MSHYIVNYFHTYLVHVGAWGTYYGFMRIKDSKSIRVISLLSVSSLLAILSSLAHNHYIHFLK